MLYSTDDSNRSLNCTQAPVAFEELPAQLAAASVSIVIVCYNQARYLRDAIESALAQSHPAMEILLVDDGSTDQTPEIAREYPQLRYLRQNNRGLSAARNTG